MNDSWTWCPLGKIFEIGAGKTMSAAARNGMNKTSFLRTSNVLWDEIDLSTVDEMAIHDHELPDKLLQPGDLLVCEGGEIGRAAIWTGSIKPMSFQNHLHRLRPIAENVEPRFYVYFLQAAFTQLGYFEGAGNKTTIPNISRNRLAALDVPHPRFAEQQAITATLAHIRKAIMLHDRMIKVSRDLKHEAMQALFMRGLRGESQKETEIGSIPESWELFQISDLGKIITGNTPPTKDPINYVGGVIPFIAPGDIEHGSTIQATEKHITECGLEKTRRINQDVICFVCIGATIGKVGYATAPVCATNQQINSIKPRDDFKEGLMN